MKFEEKVSRLILAQTKGFGPSAFNKLCEIFKEDITELLNSNEKEIEKLLGQKLAKALIYKRNNFDADKFITNLQKRKVTFCVKGDEVYPTNLTQVSDFPPVLFYRGNLQQSELQNSIAIVGTRNYSQYGENVTKKFVKELVERNFSIVSGLAMGIDYIAQKTCIENKGYTVAVIPSSPDNPIPKTNEKLYNQILENGGAIISEEYDVNATIRPEFFAKRNRIVAGISIATLIIEAGIKSGALITANNAFDNNRMVFGIPGSIYQEKSKGVNNLIKENKAKLTENIDDIVLELGILQEPQSKNSYVPKTEIEAKVIEIIYQSNISSNELSKVLNIDISTINSCISMMEIEGAVAKDNEGNIRCMGII